MAKFVQIRDMAFNPALVTDVHFSKDGDEHPHVTLYFASGHSDTLFVESYTAFKSWWEQKADVYKVV